LTVNIQLMGKHPMKPNFLLTSEFHGMLQSSNYYLRLHTQEELMCNTLKYQTL
jgi:hypothetical protein